MESYLFIKERESQKWYLWGELPRDRFKDGRKIRCILRKWIFPKPESVSPFIEAHKIIQAESKEEAWQNLNLR
jgi:hypothetical protein